MTDGAAGRRRVARVPRTLRELLDRSRAAQTRAQAGPSGRRFTPRASGDPNLKQGRALIGPPNGEFAMPRDGFLHCPPTASGTALQVAGHRVSPTPMCRYTASQTPGSLHSQSAPDGPPCSSEQATAPLPPTRFGQAARWDREESVRSRASETDHASRTPGPDCDGDSHTRRCHCPAPPVADPEAPPAAGPQDPTSARETYPGATRTPTGSSRRLREVDPPDERRGARRQRRSGPGSTAVAGPRVVARPVAHGTQAEPRDDRGTHQCPAGQPKVGGRLACERIGPVGSAARRGGPKGGQLSTGGGGSVFTRRRHAAVRRRGSSRSRHHDRSRGRDCHPARPRSLRPRARQ
jgi:hypothetical protein